MQTTKPKRSKRQDQTLGKISQFGTVMSKAENSLECVATQVKS